MEICTGSFFVIDDQILPVSCFQDYWVENPHSVYEVIRIIEGVPLFCEKHINRLYNSAASSNMILDLSYDYIMKKIYMLIQINGLANGNIKVIFHSFGNKSCPELNWYIYFIPHHYPTQENYQEGVAVILIRAERVNPNIKASNTNMRSRIASDLKEHGAYEALLVDAHGNITEGSRSNVFFISNKALLTAGHNSILPGITRDAVLEICRLLHYPVIEEHVPQEHLHLMDAVFITGTSPGVLPVQRIDNLVFESAGNPVVLDIMRTYNQLIDEYIKSHKLL